MFNPFRKKQPVREEQRESYLPPDLERFRNRDTGDAPVKSLEFPYQPAKPSILEMPEKDRKFRAFAREMGEDSDVNSPITPSNFPQNKPTDNSSKLDMILQKLETIDLRLKVIEQKMERRPIYFSQA